MLVGECALGVARTGCTAVAGLLLLASLAGSPSASHLDDAKLVVAAGMLVAGCGLAHGFIILQVGKGKGRERHVKGQSGPRVRGPSRQRSADCMSPEAAPTSTSQMVYGMQSARLQGFSGSPVPTFKQGGSLAAVKGAEAGRESRWTRLAQRSS